MNVDFDYNSFLQSISLRRGKKNNNLNFGAIQPVINFPEVRLKSVKGEMKQRGEDFNTENSVSSIL